MLEGVTATVAAGTVLLLILLTTVLSGLLDWSGPIRLRHWLEEAGGRLRSLAEQPRRLEALRAGSSLTARLLPVLAAVSLLLPVAQGWLWPSRLGWLLAVVAAAAVGEWMGRWLAGRHAEAALRWATPALRSLYIALTPAALLLERLLPPRAENGTTPDAGPEEATQDEIEAFIRVGTHEGILQPEEEELVWRIVDFGDTQVRSVMRPRTEIVCASVDSTPEALMRTFLEARHSRIPIYRESIDEIIGIVHLRDLLAGMRADPPTPVADLLSTPLVVPESELLPALLREMQAERQQMAIVVDEYGGTAGLVTAEDLVEELVGEILDEHELRRPAAQALPDGSWRLDGSCPVESLHELFDVPVDGAPSETVGGLVFSALGHLPRPGDVARALGLELRVERVGGRRVRTVIVEPPSLYSGQEGS